MRQDLGILLKIGATLCLTLMIAAIKALDGAIPTGEVVFFRSAFALVPLGIWLALQGDVLSRVRMRNLSGHLFRGLSGTGGMVFSYLAVIYLPLAQAVAISFVAPLVTVILAAILLSERVPPSRWSAVAVGLAGVLVMLSPGLSGGTLGGGIWSAAAIGTAFGLTSACFAALTAIQVRHLSAREHPAAIVLYFSVLTAAFGLGTAVFGWTMPTAGQAALLVGSGLVGGLAQILMTVSLRYAPASLLARFDYTALIWAGAIDVLVVGALPSRVVLIGAAIVAAAGAFAAWRDRARARLIRTKPGHAAPASRRSRKNSPDVEPSSDLAP